MTEPLADQILKKLAQVSTLYNRLILLVGTSSSGKTETLLEIQSKTSSPIVNVNLELSRLLLDLTERQRSLQVSRILTDMLNKYDNDLILLDNMELLFDVTLKIDPLKLLQDLSRNKTIVVAWNGSVDNGKLLYAKPVQRLGSAPPFISIYLESYIRTRIAKIFRKCENESNDKYTY